MSKTADNIYVKAYFILLLFFSLSASSETLESCHNSLKEIMQNSDNHAQMQKILQLQGKITLHRLAWAGMNKQDAHKSFKIENRIDELLSQMDSNQDPEFLKAKSLFNKNKLSRSGLARILPFIKDILNEQNEVTDPEQRKKYLLQSNDIKILAILAEKEALRGDGSNLFDHKLKEDHNSDRSILSFTKIINSSMREKDINEKTKSSFLTQIDILTKKMNNQILTLPLSEPCKFILVNQCRENTDINPLSEDFMTFLQSLSDFEKEKNLKYGDIWLDTRNKTYVAPEDIIERYIDPEYQIPPSISEVLISKPEYNATYMNELATQVLDRYPYFTSRNQLLEDKELLFALADALDKKQNYFVYKGSDDSLTKRYLPEGYNRSNIEMQGEKIIKKLLKSSPNQFGGISEMFDEKKKEKKKLVEKLRTSIPRGFNKELSQEFLHTILGANLGSPKQKTFEFRGALYKSSNGERIYINVSTVDQLKNFEILGVATEKSPIDIYNGISEEQRNKAHLAAANNKKSYIYNNKIHHLSNSLLDKNNLIKTKTKLSPKNFNKLLGNINNTSPRDEANILQAIIEGDSAVLVGSEVVNPLTLSPYSHQNQEKMIKLFQKSNDIPRTDYVSLGPNKKQEWFMAVLNNSPTFEFHGDKYNSLTAQKSEDPIQATPEGMISYSVRKNVTERLNQLDDKNLIIEYHKNFKSKEQCSYYSIVDKKNQSLSVYNKDGEVQYTQEVLLGTNKGDQRLRFREYKAKGKETNGKTSAGIFYSYDFRTTQDDNYYDVFDNCLLAMVTEKGAFDGPSNKEGDYETILAVHQTPKGYDHRNPLYNNGNLEDNRETNGCINLAPAACKEYKTRFADQGCPIYVLPEETDESGTRSNRMKITGGKLAFTPMNRSKCMSSGPCDRDYFYSPLRSEEIKKIDIKVLNPTNASNDTVKKFVKTLEDKKLELANKMGVSDSEYNDLAAMAYAILGIESGFGKEQRYKIKEGDLFKEWGRKIASPPTLGGKLIGKLLQVFGQDLGQKVVSTVKTIDGNASDNSRGLTQIKNVREYTKKHYPHINENNIDEPENAAIATMLVLKEMNHTLKSSSGEHMNITADNRAQFLYYIYNGALSQVRNGAAAPAVNVRAREIKRYLEEVHIYEESK